jgi:hypothetical protein
MSKIITIAVIIYFSVSIGKAQNTVPGLAAPQPAKTLSALYYNETDGQAPLKRVESPVTLSWNSQHCWLTIGTVKTDFAIEDYQKTTAGNAASESFISAGMKQTAKGYSVAITGISGNGGTVAINYINPTGVKLYSFMANGRSREHTLSSAGQAQLEKERREREIREMRAQQKMVDSVNASLRRADDREHQRDSILIAKNMQGQDSLYSSGNTRNPASSMTLKHQLTRLCTNSSQVKPCMVFSGFLLIKMAM